jgi:hypothetical protein
MLNLTFWLVVVFLLVLIVEMLRRKILLEKFAIVWISMALALIAGATFPEAVNTVSRMLGFQYLSNFVLFIFTIINLAIAMQISLSISRLEHQNQTLAEETALLTDRIRNLEKG